MGAISLDTRLSMPRDTECVTVTGWQRLTPHHLALGYRYIEIMCIMNHASYATDKPDVYVRRMVRRPCEYFYFLDPDFEVVCGFRWMKRLKKFQLMSVGFVGAIMPCKVLDIVVDRVQAFIRDKRVDYVVAVRPYQMDHPGIMDLYELARSHPGISVQGTHRIARGIFWRIYSKGPARTHAISAVPPAH